MKKQPSLDGPRCTWRGNFWFKWHSVTPNPVVKLRSCSCKLADVFGGFSGAYTGDTQVGHAPAEASCMHQCTYGIFVVYPTTTPSPTGRQ